MIGVEQLRSEEAQLDGVSAAASASATGGVAGAVGIFALKQATSATDAAAAVLLQALAPTLSAPNPPHLGQNVDASV